MSRPGDGEERWENVQELRNVAAQYDELEPEHALASFLEDVALISDVDEYDEKADAVTLITLHAAKGLEFPVVFMIGMEEGVLPHIRSLERQPGADGGGAPALLRRHDARQAAPLPRARLPPRLQRPQPASRFLTDIPRHAQSLRASARRSAR